MTGTHPSNPGFHCVSCQQQQQRTGGGGPGCPGQPGQACSARPGPADACPSRAPRTGPHAAKPGLRNPAELLSIPQVSPCSSFYVVWCCYLFCSSAQPFAWLCSCGFSGCWPSMPSTHLAHVITSQLFGSNFVQTSSPASPQLPCSTL